MRSAIIVHFAVTGLLALAVIALYCRPCSVGDLADPPTALPVRDGGTDGIDQLSADRKELEHSDAQIAALTARLDAIAQDIASMQTANERVAVQSVTPAAQPTAEVFRNLHEKTILAILADDRARLASEAKRKEVLELVDAFWRDHQLPEDGREQVVSLLMEQGRRANEIFERYSSGNGWPAENDPRRPEWVAAWNQFQVWRNSQILPPLDASTTEELRKHMLAVWESVFIEPHGRKR